MKKFKRDRIKRIAAAICALLVLVAFLSSIVMQATMASAANTIEQAKEKTKEAKKDLESAESKKSAIVDEFNALDKKISDTEYEIDVLNAEIEQIKSEITALEEALVVTEEELRQYQELFKARARTMYENTEMDYLEILFESESFSDFLAKIDIITSIMDYDQGVLDKIEETKRQILSMKMSLDENLAAQEANVATLESNVQLLNDARGEKQKLLDEINADVEKYKAVYEAALAAENAFIKSNSGAFSYGANPVIYTGGKFAWPVPATQRISSYYGYRIHPIYKTRKFHSGIDISAAYGNDIVAAAAGTVTMSTYNGGYGKCIVINHGSGISTLYGHNSTLLVSNGDKVSKGQLIAKAGSTGLSTGPHLHYEIRVNGATVDPLSYYSK